MPKRIKPKWSHASPKSPNLHGRFDEQRSPPASRASYSEDEPYGGQFAGTASASNRSTYDDTYPPPLEEVQDYYYDQREYSDPYGEAYSANPRPAYSPPRYRRDPYAPDSPPRQSYGLATARAADHDSSLYAPWRRGPRTPSPPSHTHQARLRSPSPYKSPASPMPFLHQRAPTPTYLLTSTRPSQLLADPTTARKLLILDLNGSLLVRGPHKTGARLRPVHPRPYMSVFRSFLFDPRTRAWLDTMVWSSAQPHSVDDMVRACFGEGAQGRERLVAVWARDTLGLTRAEYNKKTQTTKDLDKPWRLLATPPSTAPSDGSRSSSPRSPSPARATHVHSARTTLLLDDSPDKARLQPWNHVCISEYTMPMRHADLNALAATPGALATPSPAPDVPTVTSDETSVQVDAAVGELLPSASEETVKAKAADEQEPEPSIATPATETASSVAEDKPVDVTLLAVIGVLDELKTQDNVAGWIRAGGLWGDVADRPHKPDMIKGETAAQVEEPLSDMPSVDEVDGVPVPGPVVAKEHIDADQAQHVSSPGAKEDSKRAMRALHSHEGEPALSGAGNDANADADADAVPGLNLSMESNATSVGLEGPTFADEPEKMWFQHPPSMAYWAARGRKACEEMGFEVVHGL